MIFILIVMVNKSPGNNVTPHLKQKKVKIKFEKNLK